MEEQGGSRGCAAELLAEAPDQAVAATYSFDPVDWPRPASVTIRFVGTREDADGQSGDFFDRLEQLGTVDPRGGRISVTTRAGNVRPGRWRVTATPTVTRVPNRLPVIAIVTSTRYTMLAQGPAVRLAAWPLLVGMGAVVALMMQALLVGRAGAPVLPVLGLSLLGCLLGYPAAKLWFLAAQRRGLRDFLQAGAHIQGFLLASLATVTVGTSLLGLSPGAILDATAPGIFLGMAVGRPGCFFTGCCAGRPTLSRWGLRSSDRRLVVRRVPVQLLEAAAALVIGLVTLTLALAATSPFAGAVFVAAISGYVFVRQLLFRLRVQSHTRTGRLLAQALSGAVVLGLVVWWGIG